MKNVKIKLGICTAFLVIYGIIFGSTSFLSGFLHDRANLAFAFESKIPLYPMWSFVYLSINFYLLCGLVVFREWQPMAVFAITLVFETLCAGILFLIFPTKLIYAPAAAGDGISSILYTAQLLSMNNNYFPSLHTAFSVTAFLMYRQYCSAIAKIGFFIWTCAIPLSTLLIHEHQIADLIAGTVLALAAYWYVVPRVTHKLTTLSARRDYAMA